MLQSVSCIFPTAKGTCFTMESDTDESVPGNIVQKLREDGLLVPEESITTLNIVGEGKFYKNE